MLKNANLIGIISKHNNTEQINKIINKTISRNTIINFNSPSEYYNNQSNKDFSLIIMIVDKHNVNLLPEIKRISNFNRKTGIILISDFEIDEITSKLFDFGLDFFIKSDKVNDILQPIAKKLVRNYQSKKKIAKLEVSLKKYSEYVNYSAKYKKMEKQISELKRIASLGHLSAGIAHEIRNPLTSMNMFCSYILESFDDNDERKNIMQKIVSEINRLENLVKNISTFSRSTPLNKTMFNLYQAIEGTLFFVNQHIVKKKIIVKNLVEKEIMLFADLEKIKQVFINIFINSINAMEDNGVLIIMANKNKTNTIIEISDTGCGIPEKIIKKIFEPFFSTDSQSSGLGLPIVQKIISQHNGDIEISNRTDGKKGTIIRITLPRMKND